MAAPGILRACRSFVTENEVEGTLVRDVSTYLFISRVHVVKRTDPVVSLLPTSTTILDNIAM